MPKKNSFSTWLMMNIFYRLSEPDPNHTLEERVVHWYFKQLDKNASGDIGKKEIKPFKRFLRKKSKPKKCVKKFVEYCDVNNDKSLTVAELMGCLGVTKEDNKADTKKRHSKRISNYLFYQFTYSLSFNGGILFSRCS